MNSNSSCGSGFDCHFYPRLFEMVIRVLLTYDIGNLYSLLYHVKKYRNVIPTIISYYKDDYTEETTGVHHGQTHITDVNTESGFHL